MNLDVKTMRLIAVGAAISANCQPCLQTCVAKALDAGIGEQDITEAIEVGKMVRHGAAAKMDQFITSLTPAAAHPADGGCGCH